MPRGLGFGWVGAGLGHSTQISQATNSLLSKKLPKENTFHTFPKSDAFRLNTVELIRLHLRWLSYNYCSRGDESLRGVVHLLEQSECCT